MSDSIKNYNKNAKEWAERLRSGQNLAHKYLEKPAMYSLLPNLEGKNILCIGCGSGEECNYLMSKKPAKVTGIDLSSELINIAKTSYPEIEFKVMDIESMSFEPESFDFIYSSLTMHYSNKWPKVLADIFSYLKLGNTFLFSTDHPLIWGSKVERGEDSTSKLIGYKKEGIEYEIFGDYFNNRKINDIWFGNLEVSYYNLSISEMFSLIKSSGFTIEEFVEPKSTEDCKIIDPEFYKLHQRIPLFVIFKLKKEII